MDDEELEQQLESLVGTLKDPLKDEREKRMTLGTLVRQKSARAFRTRETASVFIKPGEAVNELCCFSIIGRERTLDLVAPSNRVRDDWLRALRMLLVHANTTGSITQACMHGLLSIYKGP